MAECCCRRLAVKRKFDRIIIAQAATRPFHTSHYHTFPPAFPHPISGRNLYSHPRDLTKSLDWTRILRVRPYSTITDLPTSQSDLDALLAHKLSQLEPFDPTSDLLLPSSGESLSQGDFHEQVSRYTRLSRSQNRFDWRLRASSRSPKKEGEADTEQQTPPKRKRLQDLQSDLGPFRQAFEDYKLKCVHLCFLFFFFFEEHLLISGSRFFNLLQLEEKKEAATLQNRLSTWGIHRLEREGYCQTSLYAYWLSANRFGKPVASFSLGPGIILPDSKLEYVFSLSTLESIS